MIKRISVLLLLLALSMTALFGCSQTKETKHASAIINTDKTNKEENLIPDRKSTRLNSSHVSESRMPSSA